MRTATVPKRDRVKAHRLLGLEFSVQCSEFRVQCSVFSVQCSVFSVQGSGFRVQGCWVQGAGLLSSGFRVLREKKARPLATRFGIFGVHLKGEKYQP